MKVTIGTKQIKEDPDLNLPSVGYYDHHIDLDVLKDVYKIVLVGNPNVGKSVIFNALTGMYADVSNYPGTTLAIKYGKYGDKYLIDTPGVYGVSSFSDEERLTRDAVLSADLVINVVDALHLERDLFLTQHIIDCAIPMIMVLNMLDDAKAQGIRINGAMLSELLGVPVIRSNATTKSGIRQIQEAIDLNQGAIGRCSGEDLPLVLMEMKKTVMTEIAEALLILEGDPVIAERYGVAPLEQRETLYAKRRQRVNEVLSQVQSERDEGLNFATRLSRWMIQPKTGFPILLVVLFFMYQFIGVFIAQQVVDFTEGRLMNGHYVPFVQAFVSQWLPLDSWLGYILAGQFGVLTMAISYIFGLLLPLVLGFYLLLSILEDSGYLPRLAILTDRMMMGIGLNGRAVIPFILGFGCITLATVVTRMLERDRERLITIILLVLVVPCSAQLGIVTAMLAGVGGEYAALFLVVLICVVTVAGVVLNRLLPGKSSDLLLDLPPLRRPQWHNIWRKAVGKSGEFIVEAAPIFALGTILISLLKLTGLLDALQGIMAPLVVGWLNLPPEAATAFIMGLIRRDFGAAGLNDLHLAPMETIVALIVITLFVPCMASTLVMVKERGKKQAVLIWVGCMIIAFWVGGIVNKLTNLFAGNVTGIIVTSTVFIVVTLAIGQICKVKEQERR